MIVIDKPGRSKKELLEGLEKLKSDFSSQISQYDIKISPAKDGYNLKVNKKIIFVDFSADINITAEEGKYVINYTTKNIPQGKIDEALVMVRQTLDRV